jgi:hypothetical protein
MDEIGKLIEHLGYGTSLLYAAAAYGLFAWLDNEASDDAKAKLAGTLKLTEWRNKDVASAVVEVFDRIYSSPLLSWHAFRRSTLFTLLVTAFFAFETRDQLIQPDQPISTAWLLGSLAFSTAVSILIDYLSLFAIRPWLVRSGDRPIFALVMGTLISVIVFVVGVFIRVVLAMIFALTIKGGASGNGDWSNFGLGLAELFVPLRISFLFSLPGIVVFAWLPLFALGIIAIRVFVALSWTVGKAQWALKDGKQRPLKAVGYVAAVAVFVIAAGWQTIFKA